MSTPVSSIDGSAFNVSADLLLIGKIIARGSPGVTVYDADMRVGPRTTKAHLSSVSCKIVPIWQSADLNIAEAVRLPGCCQKITYWRCSGCRRGCICERDVQLSACLC